MSSPVNDHDKRARDNVETASTKPNTMTPKVSTQMKGKTTRPPVPSHTDDDEGKHAEDTANATEGEKHKSQAQASTRS